MTTQRFSQGRIRQADHDPRSQQLDLHFDNGSVLAYKQVPNEVFRRLCSSPNPTTYWEDRIAEEYPKAVPARKSDAAPSAKAWDELFGGKLS